MESSKAPLLSALGVFKNVINEELIRSFHVYQLEDGNEIWVEREFLFSTTSSYVEMVAQPVLKLSKVKMSELYEGQMMGIWFCMLVFNISAPSRSIPIPSILLISRLPLGAYARILGSMPLFLLGPLQVFQYRSDANCKDPIYSPLENSLQSTLLDIMSNPKLKSIPTLVDDLQKVYQLSYEARNKQPVVITDADNEEINSDNSHTERAAHVLDQDLNCLPYTGIPPPAENYKSVRNLPAVSERIAELALDDLVKYFDLPITEASKILKVGLTVLKRKCRELGIPRWPHRKIKSLDTLIHDLQEEAEHQERENKAAAMAVNKRKRMLENEKEIIAKKPFMDIQTETKRFRQDVFKRRHKARILQNKSK
ncbi:Rwp-rk domain-containing protein [Thalictrum thalictroides]|uniref:Rwp-rk domain-containing protein n=1 Tax=Thalictrum thalictroides TaxID=46969 RepID=A0A7J6V1P4_THATH|nr:Rwp-rk domain-containing protein [Thalictrum thalictroides]